MNDSDKLLLNRLQEQRIAAGTERRKLLERVANGENLTASEERRINELADETDRLGKLIRSGQDDAAAREEFENAAKATEARTGVNTAERPKLLMPSRSEYRTMVAGTDSAGGFVVPQKWSDQAVQYLLRDSVVLSATAANGHKIQVERMNENEGDELLLPKVSTGTATVAMIAENTAFTASDMVLSQISLKPKKGYAYTLASNESLSDSRPRLREIVFNDHVRKLARLFDDQFLFGDNTGANLKGIYNFSGINSVAFGASLANLDVFLDAINRVLTNGANPDGSVIFMHPRLWTQVMKLKTGVASSIEYLAMGDVTAGLTRRLFGVPVYLTDAFPTNQGSGTNGTPFLVVDVDQVVVAERQGIQVKYDESRYFEQDLTAVRTTARFDINFYNAGGIERVTDVKP